ncbi:MAG: hypothetical protein KF739_04625 [Cryobacterium sp.]|nr:hypothetical protein [Cryobacterium sp.]
MTDAWPPTRWTPPLSPDFPNVWDSWLGRIIRVVWKVAFGFTLDPWQEDLIRHVLEVFPKGHPRAGQLRFRQVVISLARQNGKTELAAVLGLYGLLRRANQLVIGIASSVEQSRLVYQRTMQAIAANPSLKKKFQRLTDTRGIKSHTGGQYELKASKSAALQGLPVDVGVVDELHLLKLALWSALVAGTGGRPNGIVVGITTAGDENSELLLHLYELGEKATASDPEKNRFGFYVWEAPESRMPDDDEELLEFLKAANPALASGRLDAENVITDVRSMPPVDAIRYRLNRFVTSISTFMPLTIWGKAPRPAEQPFPRAPELPLVFTIDRSPDWGYATVSATVRDGDTTHTELVASIVKPSLDQLRDIALALWEHSPALYVVDGYSLKELGAELKKYGLPVRVMSQGDVIAACAMFYAKVVQHKLRHGSDPLLTVQLPGSERKTVGVGFRIIPKDGSQIDAVMATVLGVYAAETAQSGAPQIA